MKKIVLFALLFSISFTISAQTISKPVVFKRTATWCSFCGGWGWSFMNDVEAEFSDDEAVTLKLHFSGDLRNDLNVSIATNLGGAGQPVFYLNNENKFVNSGNRPEKLMEIADEVAAINNQTPDFELNLNAFKHSDGPAITANVSIEPNINTFDKNYYVALYLIEDDVLNTQAGRTGVVKHHNIIRSTFSATPFGELFMPMGGNWNGDPLSFEYTLDDSDDYISSDYLDRNFDVALIIYSNNGGSYTIEQADIISDISEISSANELALFNEPKLFVKGNNLIVELNSDISLDDTEINIWNLNGQNLFSGSEAVQKSVDTTLRIPLSGLTNGQYIFSIAYEGGIWSRSFILAR